MVVHFYVSDFGIMCTIVMKAFMEHKGEFDDLESSSWASVSMIPPCMVYGRER